MRSIMVQTSTLSKKHQATIPANVRRTLGLKIGDLLAFDISKGGVRLRRANPAALADAQVVAAGMCEWNSETDERAFRDL